jgi:hypothetical protein
MPWPHCTHATLTLCAAFIVVVVFHRWNKLGMHLRDPRIREQVHVEMAAALEDLQQRCDTNTPVFGQIPCF